MAWVGDSQAMLFRRGQGIELVEAHKPDREVRLLLLVHFLTALGAVPFVIYRASLCPEYFMSRMADMGYDYIQYFNCMLSYSG